MVAFSAAVRITEAPVRWHLYERRNLLWHGRFGNPRKLPTFENVREFVRRGCPSPGGSGGRQIGPSRRPAARRSPGKGHPTPPRKPLSSLFLWGIHNSPRPGPVVMPRFP